MPNNSNYQFRAVPLHLIDYVKDKVVSSREYFRYLLDRTMMMFKYENLPDTIDASVLERYLQVNGVACITKGPDGNLYTFNGSWGGIQDVYYRPTKFIISNPHISQLADGTGKEFTKECTIYGSEEHDAVLMRNDTEWASLTPMIARYAVLMCENCITVRTADIMLRILALISAGTDKTQKSAEAYLKKLENGDLGVIGDSAFMETLKMQSPPSNNGSYLTQFIELQQYLKGSFFNELGLRANYNMKREAIGAGESTMDADSVLPLCDNMLMCRKEDVKKINDLFGTNISVDYSSAWLENKLETSLTFLSQLNEAGVAGGGAQSGMMSGASGGINNEPVKGADENGFDETIENTDGPTGSSDAGHDEGNGHNAEEDKSVGEGTASDETKIENGDTGSSGEDSGEGASTEEINQVKEELDKDEISEVEAYVEVVENKIAELVAEVRKGEDDDVE